MSNQSSVLQDDYLERTRELLAHLENGREEEASRALDEIAKSREDSLFRELGKLTREFHETLNSFRLDDRITDLAEKDIPDARDRLAYVITMTEQSANRTLGAVEQTLPLCERMEDEARALGQEWERFTRREMDAEEFRELARRIGAFLTAVTADNAEVRSSMQEVLMAQDFQDLTGQIIRRVITLVEDLEGSLVELIRISGQNLIAPAREQDRKAGTASGTDGKDIEAAGPPVPGVDGGDTVSGQDEVDDLLSSLGF